MHTLLYLLSAWLPHRGMLLLESTCCGTSPGAQQVKNQPAMQETQETLGLADPLEEETETQLQYSCLKNPMDRGA